MKFHWPCSNPKCLVDNNVTEIEDIYIEFDGSLFIDLGPCRECGNPHQRLRIWNQKVNTHNEVVKRFRE